MVTDEQQKDASPHIVALDKVLKRADQGLELITDSETLEKALGKLSQLAAVYLADDVYSILKQRESALLAGALTRSLVEVSLGEVWYASRPVNETPRSATLAGERKNITDEVSRSGLSVPNLSRWNNPIADPRFAVALSGPRLPNLQAGASNKARTTLEQTLLLPSPLMDLLGMCSHVNHAATWMTAGTDSVEIGVTAPPNLSAILAQSAGTALASVRGFNHQGPVLDLIAAATSCHDLDVLAPLGQPRLVENIQPMSPLGTGQALWLENEPSSVMDVLLKELKDASIIVWEIVNNAPNPFAGPSNTTNLTSALPYLAARDLLMLTIRATLGGCSPLMAPTGARMLLEQGSELAWRFSDTSDSELLKRYQAHMDNATDRKKALEQKLLTRTSSAMAVETLLFPRGRGDFAIDTRRLPNGQAAAIPAPQEHLDQLYLGSAESNWGNLAYKLLTQAAHATPLGLLHAVARVDDTGQPALSYEMTALALDAACTGAALVMRGLSPLIAHQAGREMPKAWLVELFESVRNVHTKAQIIHLLG